MTGLRYIITIIGGTALAIGAAAAITIAGIHTLTIPPAIDRPCQPITFDAGAHWQYTRTGIVGEWTDTNGDSVGYSTEEDGPILPTAQCATLGR